MNIITKLDQGIFYLVCAFSAVFFISERISDHLIGIAAFLAVIRYIKQRVPVEIPKGYLRGMQVFFAVLFIMIFLSPDIVKSAKEYWRFLNRLVPFFVAFVFIKEQRKITIVFLCLLFSMLINCGYAIFQGVLAAQAGHLYVRAAGFDQKVIDFGGHLMLFLPIMLILALEKVGHTSRKYFWGIFSFFMAGLVLNGTRIAWLVMAVILFGIVCVYIKDLKKIVIVMLSGMILCVGLVATVPFFQQRVFSFVDSNNSSNRGHFYINLDTIKMIQDQPFLGVGLGRFQKVYNEEYISAETRKVESILLPHAHNNTLMFLAETGVIGCFAYWYMYGSFLYFSGKMWLKEKRSTDMMFFAVTLAAVLQGFTDYSFGLHSVIKIYFLLVALYINSRAIENRKWGNYNV